MGSHRLQFCLVYKLSLVSYSYSGSDVAVVVRDALMQPVRKVLSATHFKQVQEPQSEYQKTLGGRWPKWTPCSPGDLDAVEKNWGDLDSEELLEPPLRLGDFVRAISQVRPTVTEEDISKHVHWTNDSGEAGA